MEFPVVQAGMGGGLACHELAAAVSEAGGLGTIGTLPPRALARELAAARARTSRPIAVNLIQPLVGGRHWKVAATADVIVTHWGRPAGGQRVSGSTSVARSPRHARHTPPAPTRSSPRASRRAATLGPGSSPWSCSNAFASAPSCLPGADCRGSRRRRRRARRGRGGCGRGSSWDPLPDDRREPRACGLQDEARGGKGDPSHGPVRLWMAGATPRPRECRYPSLAGCRPAVPGWHPGAELHQRAARSAAASRPATRAARRPSVLDAVQDM